MTDFATEKSHSFDGLEFPVRSRKITGGLRDHVHEFPHTPGGKPEKMGRKLYEFEFEIGFLSGSTDAKWADLWPTRLGSFRSKFDKQLTSDLLLPAVGTVKAYCFDWGQEADLRKMRNGEVATWKFREDQDDLELTKALTATGPASIGAKMEQLNLMAAEAGEPDLFTQLTNAVDDVLAWRDQALLRASQLESKILYASYLCREADRTIDMFNDPGSFRILEALKDLWAAMNELAANFTQEAGTVRSYTTPTEMTITDVSLAVFGDATRGMDILQLNAVNDPFEIPAGTKLKYITEAAA
jgi:hypothetical protein